MTSKSTHHDSMQQVSAGVVGDQAFLDEVFERAVRLVEDGLIPETDALLAGHEALRAEVERLVQLARHVAVGATTPHPVVAGFTILQQLGQGGMGTVYLARQHSLGGRPVALKVLPNSAALSTRARARFLAEASAIARLRHPNIVAVHDVVHQGDVYAYAMEWVDGSSLAEVIEATKRQSDGATKGKEKESDELDTLQRKGRANGIEINACANVSRPDRLAEGDDAGGSLLSVDRRDAEGRAVRSDVADPSRGGVDSLEHRRGARPSDPGGLSSISPDGARLADGASNANHAGAATPLPSGAGAIDRRRPGSGSNSASADSGVGAEVATEGEQATKRRSDGATEGSNIAPPLSHPPSSLRRSVASSLSVPDLCRIGLAIARALESVHAAGLLHRDVKPSNILLRRDGTPLLADFGLARDLASSIHTQAGHFAGTVAYAPPEQLRGDAPRGVRTSGPPDTNSIPRGGRGRPHSPDSGDAGKGTGGVDARSDVYALGVTLYHALALRLPFEARHPAAMLRRIESGAAMPLRKMNPRVPRDLETIVATAMETDPARRYQTAADLADDLERFMNFQPIRARPAGWPTRCVKLVRRNRGAALGLALGSVLTLLLGIAMVTYVFFLPGWVAGHLRNARLALLDPGKANNIVSTLYWGRTNPFSAEQRAAQAQALAPALASYDKALRWSMHDPQIQQERDIVARARDDLENSLVRESLRAPTPAGIPSHAKQAPAGARIPSRTHSGRSRSRLGDNPFLRGEAETRTWEGISTDVRARKDSRTSEGLVEHDPRSRGLYAYLIHDIETAIKSWEEYEQSRNPIAQPDPLVDGALGVLYLFDDQAARAYPRLQKAVEAFPGVGFLMEYLADAAAKCGDAGRARRWLEESKQLPRRDPMGAAERIHAGVLAAEGRTDAAIAAYRGLTWLGPSQIELAALLQREGRLDEALNEYARLPAALKGAPRVGAAYRRCAEKWWAAQPKADRRQRIRATLDNGPDSILTLLRHYAASIRSGDADSRTRTEAGRRPAVPSFQISNLKFQILAALYEALSSPLLVGLSLNELAERMEVLDMGLWSRINSMHRLVRKLRVGGWRLPFVGEIASGWSSLRHWIQTKSIRRPRVLGTASMLVATTLNATLALGQARTYDAALNTLPQSQDWLFSQGGSHPAPFVTSGTLHQGPTLSDCSQGWQYWYRNDVPISFADPIVIQATLQILSSNDLNTQGPCGFDDGWKFGYHLGINDSASHFFFVGISSGGVCLINSQRADPVDTPRFTLPTTDGFHTYRLEIHDNNASLYFDDSLITSKPIGNDLNTGAGNNVSWGDGSHLGSSESLLTSFSCIVGAPCVAADVSQPPSSTTVPFGGSVQLSVVAAGTGPITYQWRKDNVNLVDGSVGCGGAISGATTDTLVLNTVTFVEAGDYDCVVTNACGNDASAVATLTINPPPAAADVNHDGQVNGADIQALVNALLAP